MQDFIFFLGRFHVLVLHLPIGILMLAVIMEAMVRLPRFASLAPALSLVWLLGALSALLTVTLGYMHATEPGFTGPAVNEHRWAGTALAAAAFVVWAWRIELPASFGKIWPVPLLIILALMTVTGHLGGNLTHGSTYLTEFAPGPLRSGPAGGATAPRAKPTALANADIYLDVVAPALNSRCASCHNNDKKRGGLSFASYDALMKGGEDGPVVVGGKSDGSELLRRVTLPPTHDDYMPKNNKAPLSPDQIAAIRWWISVGAPDHGEIGTLKPPADLNGPLTKAAGL